MHLMALGCHLVKATLLLGPGVGLNDATTGGDVWMIGISFIHSWWLLVIILFGYSDDHGCYDLVSWCVHYWYFSMKTYGTPPDAQEIILHPFLVHHWGSGSAISDRYQAIGGEHQFTDLFLQWFLVGTDGLTDLGLAHHSLSGDSFVYGTFCAATLRFQAAITTLRRATRSLEVRSLASGRFWKPWTSWHDLTWLAGSQ